MEQAIFKRLPAQTIKNNQSFVRDILRDNDCLALTEAVIRLASVFGCQVIAEGVETAELGARLLQLDCNLAQGYGIARPMPANQVIDWAAQFKPDPAWGMWSGAHWKTSATGRLAGPPDAQSIEVCRLTPNPRR